MTAANIDPTEAEEDTVRTNNDKNVIVISSPSIERAKAYNKITTLKIKEHEHQIVAYATPPEECTKGVIHNIPSEESEEIISRSLVNKRNPTILRARRMGKRKLRGNRFRGRKRSLLVYYRGTEYRCYLHRKRHEICNTYGRLGHRADVCPAPERRYPLAVERRIPHRITLACPNAHSAEAITKQGTRNAADATRHPSYSRREAGRRRKEP
ncbi:hypothetical protein HPB48_012143 [Haemaphysalis longicornis]|uniref:Uncharacterized protein n=1 Tax=Haemaphysalis longicornis TaxID=44386 RepID=A0A9J6GCZ8_HAELO|nr:hypothetical protein HPB48_012143 [Haemaphysalis longicornis]